MKTMLRRQFHMGCGEALCGVLLRKEQSLSLGRIRRDFSERLCTPSNTENSMNRKVRK